MEPLWERACSRMRCTSHCTHRLAGRLREQARSHIEYSACKWNRASPLPHRYNAHPFFVTALS
ncbi:hypothetical protein EGJ55_00540 [Pseudomonas moraviensis]|nr:hypothetical protein EGJ55_00540 [Pseudomonas moraviensis]